MTRWGQAAVAVHRPGLVLLRPKHGKGNQRLLGHGAANRPRIRPRMILAEQLRKTNGVGIQLRVHKIIGAGTNRDIIALKPAVVGQTFCFEFTVVGLILFPACTGADAIVSVVASNS